VSSILPSQIAVALDQIYFTFRTKLFQQLLQTTKLLWNVRLVDSRMLDTLYHSTHKEFRLGHVLFTIWLQSNNLCHYLANFEDVCVIFFPSSYRLERPIFLHQSLQHLFILAHLRIEIGHGFKDPRLFGIGTQSFQQLKDAREASSGCLQRTDLSSVLLVGHEIANHSTDNGTNALFFQIGYSIDGLGLPKVEYYQTGLNGLVKLS
jgi:hypothetical protein